MPQKKRTIIYIYRYIYIYLLALLLDRRNGKLDAVMLAHIDRRLRNFGSIWYYLRGNVPCQDAVNNLLRPFYRSVVHVLFWEELEAGILAVLDLGDLPRT